MNFRSEMMRAVREAAAPSALFKGSTLANGRRAIRTFERVNGIPFDPFNQAHREKVRGQGVHEQLFQRFARYRVVGFEATSIPYDKFMGLRRP